MAAVSLQNQCRQSAAPLICHLHQLQQVENIDSCCGRHSPAADAVHILHNQEVVVAPLEDLVLEISGLYRWVEDDARAGLGQVVEDWWVYLRRCKNNLVGGLQGWAANS